MEITTSRYTSTEIGPYVLTWVDSNIVVKHEEQEMLYGTFWRAEGRRLGFRQAEGFRFLCADGMVARASFGNGFWAVMCM